MDPQPRDPFWARAFSLVVLMVCATFLAPEFAHGMDTDDTEPAVLKNNQTRIQMEPGCLEEELFATAKTATWKNPEFDDWKLAFCTGDACGASPAKWFCQMKGFEDAKSFKKSSGKCGFTKSIGTDEICKGKKSCVAFKEIICEDPVIDCPEEARFRVTGGVSFENPEFDGRKVDYCAGPDEGCGKEAADLFCIYGSFPGALRWLRFDDITIGRNTSCRSTVQLGTLGVCDGTCDGFRRIVCDDPPPQA